MTPAALPVRFSQPLTAYTMSELQAHIEMHAIEVQRVANICAYYKREVLPKKPQPAKVAKLRSIR